MRIWKSSARHTPPLCGTPLVEGRADAVGERRARHTPPLFCHVQISSTRSTGACTPSRRGEENGELETIK
ncbi:MAG: hypothetical protein J6T88_07060 [Bacteroidales bacterium]|nr:hypothetical protein [Bacteroidales bacterium]